MDALTALGRGYFFASPPLAPVGTGTSLAQAVAELPLEPKRRVIAPLAARDADELSRIYWLESGKQAFAKMPARTYFFASGEGFASQYCVLPIPWQQVDFSGEAPVQVMVRIGEGAEKAKMRRPDPFRLAVAVQDRMIGTVLGYLATGELPAAAVLVERARDMLFQKMANPLAATAGAYVLLASKLLDEPEPWHGWIKNLNQGFPWIPDGAIQYAWLCLQQQDADLDVARGALLEGYRRGLPYFSRGVRLLMDGLTLFSNEARQAGHKDEEVDEALVVVTTLAARTNMRQPFTTVLLR